MRRCAHRGRCAISRRWRARRSIRIGYKPSCVLIRDELGYELYRAVSGVKAELSRAETAVLNFKHADFEINETITRGDFEGWIAPDIARIASTVDAALAQSGLADAAIDRVFLTGGTSLVPAVRGLFEARFGQHRVTGGGEFVSVAEGLALIGRDRTASR